MHTACPPHDKAPNNTFVPVASMRLPAQPMSPLTIGCCSNLGPPTKDGREAQTGRTMGVCCLPFYNRHPGTKPTLLPMDSTQPKTPLPLLPPASPPTLAKQRSMWRRATCMLTDSPQETQKICRFTLFPLLLLVCTGQWKGQ